MDKFEKELNDTATVSELLTLVNKKEKRTRMDYLKYYIPAILLAILVYTAVILFIVFAIKKWIPQFILTFTVIFLLCGWGIFDKYFSLKIFKKIREDEIKKLIK